MVVAKTINLRIRSGRRGYLKSVDVRKRGRVQKPDLRNVRTSLNTPHGNIHLFLFNVSLMISGVLKGNIEKKLVKGALSSPAQFLAIESPLKIMKNVFYFTLKALFVL